MSDNAEYDVPSLRADFDTCPVVTDQEGGVGPGLFLVCNRPLPCPKHSTEGRVTDQ